MASLIRQSAQSVGNRIYAQSAGMLDSRSGQRFCNPGGASNRRRATSAQELQLKNHVAFDASRQLQYVSAYWICHFNAMGSRREFTRMPRTLEMIENLFGKHSHHFNFAGRYFFSIEAITT
jgi:hypothetical protein